MSDPVIRPFAAARDAADCLALMAVSEPWTGLGLGPEALEASVHAPGRARFVAEVDGRFAGFLFLNLHGPLGGYLQTVAVAPEFRGRGLGTALVAFAEARIFEVHRNALLCVSARNPGARRLYERLGWSLVGPLPDFLVPGEDELLLRKSRGPLYPGGPVRV